MEINDLRKEFLSNKYHKILRNFLVKELAVTTTRHGTCGISVQS